ncbi:hypothetical protein [Rhizobium sp. SSA_523]|uniref:hypothetical protein n=1 Tax=Rhizobium sp. SSA_523 TaxID=2952477 RepID=UPI002090FBE1|nr:hypothetical protein [Rhizobium sp. SSA_523]MCO5734106.1 hypothetical protein [Rhizobium sp. SSA_523]WKC24743.1 hypothetical protein QTJ18_12005 [Rhizobium sp. SSA_523]
MRLNDAWMYRMKAAQRDLIEACGTVRRVEEKYAYGKSTIGRWSNPLDATLMPLNAVVALEADCGIPFVTQVLAELSGRRLTDPEEERAAEVCVMASHAELMRQTAELANSIAMAIADGKVTPTEAHTVDRVAANLQTATSDVRAALASIKSKGGVPAALRVVGDGE